MKDLVHTAKYLYERHQGPGAFADALLRCLFYGIICDRSNMFVLAEPCYTDGKAILPPPNDCNCWWIHYAGYRSDEVSFCDMLDQAPYPLDYIAFRRRDRVRIYRFERLKKKDIHYGWSTQCLSTAEA